MEKKDDIDRISKRAKTVKRVASRAMTDIVASLKAQGKEILPLKGGPYWTPPEHVLAAAERETKVMSAPPSQGFPELCRAIANRLETDDRLRVDPEHEILNYLWSPACTIYCIYDIVGSWR